MNRIIALLIAFILTMPGTAQAAKIMPFPKACFYDNNGDPYAGGKLNSYVAGTSTPLATYTDVSEGTANANPVILDSAGCADVWLGDGSYKLNLTDSADVSVWTVDDIQGETAAGFLAEVNSISTSTNITSAYDQDFIVVTAASTLSLLAAATAEEGFTFSVYNASSGNVTVDPDGSEEINDTTTLTIYPGGTATVVSDGDEWFTSGVSLGIPSNPSPASGDVLYFSANGSPEWGSFGIPTGTVLFYASSTAPSGWSMAYGQAVSRTTYSDLFNIVGTTFGSGDGSTTFNLPDCRGHVIAGWDNMGGVSGNNLTTTIDGDVFYNSGGTETHTMTVSEMPQHDHPFTYRGNETSGLGGTGDGALMRSGTTNLHTVDVDVDTVGTGNNGSGNAFNITQPTIILNCIIKF